MNKQAYKDQLDRDYLDTCAMHEDSKPSRLEFLGDHVFDFVTYESRMAELFASKAIEVCKAITDAATFDYIKTPDGHAWFLVMCNMPFFADRIEWGTSIRGAWWHASTTPDGKAVKRSEWLEFVAALIEFATEGDQAPQPTK